jgi:heme/copper-type cytochrome/quinol oxidase subunit 2
MGTATILTICFVAIWLAVGIVMMAFTMYEVGRSGKLEKKWPGHHTNSDKNAVLFITVVISSFLIVLGWPFVLAFYKPGKN